MLPFNPTIPDGFKSAKVIWLEPDYVLAVKSHNFVPLHQTVDLLAPTGTFHGIDK